MGEGESRIRGMKGRKRGREGGLRETEEKDGEDWGGGERE